LSELPIYFKNYKIDLHLKRYERALTNLAQAGTEHFAACIDLTEKHRLHTHALAIYEPFADERLKAVQALTAGYLVQKCDFKEAGLMFLQAGNLEKVRCAFFDRN
jgi:elongator complex protein 1